MIISTEDFRRGPFFECLWQTSGKKMVCLTFFGGCERVCFVWDMVRVLCSGRSVPSSISSFLMGKDIGILVVAGTVSLKP